MVYRELAEKLSVFANSQAPADQHHIGEGHDQASERKLLKRTYGGLQADEICSLTIAGSCHVLYTSRQANRDTELADFWQDWAIQSA